MKRKECPLLIQSETNPSMTVEGMSRTRTYMLDCVGEKCAAYLGGRCVKYQTYVEVGEGETLRDEKDRNNICL